jgi:membrane peptidoglycan carboxypeptidase
MQTSLARRQRQRRLGDRRRGGSGAGRTVASIAIAIPLFLFGTFVLVGLLGFATVVVGYNHFSQGLGDPKQILDNLSFDQQTRIMDRTGTVELARLGTVKRDLVTFDEIPPELIDATTAIEDKTFWENAGFDPVGIISAGIDTLRGTPRGASTITQELVRARLLPQTAKPMSLYERKIKEIIQSIRLTQEYRGVAGKQAIMTAYLNQNFYGNNSYGVAAAAQSYFGKSLKDLDLAQMAILAGIPQSPTTYDLMRNAVQQCSVPAATIDDCPAGDVQLVVPADSTIVQRRDYILELMKTRSPLSGSKHTPAEYEAAKSEPVILATPTPQAWKAAQFVWQVRSELGAILCGPDQADSCEKVDTGGYTVTTTLDWSMQQTLERWLEAVARAPNEKNTDALLTQLKIPKSSWSWIKALKGENVNDAAGGIVDARTGEVYAYAGSAGYGLAGNSRFQPQFDVLSDGYRQPGSAIKPIDYSIGINDHTMTAATMFMDVVTNFGTSAKPYTPQQADGKERGPVRLREALEFSLNIPAIKAGYVNGLDHQFVRTKDFGLAYRSGTVPVISESIGTLGVHPIDMLTAYSTIANGGQREDRQMILDVTDSTGQHVWAPSDAPTKPTQVISPQAAYIITDILAGNTDKSQNPFWAQWAIYDGKTRREAAYKTGTTDDNRDVDAYGFLAPPKDPKAPQLVAGVWLGNSDNSAMKKVLSLEASAPLWSSIMTEVSKGMPLASFASSRPGGLTQTKIDAYSGMLPGPFTTKTVSEWFIAGTAPTQVDDTKVPVQIDAATGDLWQEGCAGPVETQGFLDLSNVESSMPASWKSYTDGWIARAKKGAGAVGGPRRTATQYFYGGYPAFYPFGRTWGAPFAPTAMCTPPAPSPSPACVYDPTDPFSTPCPSTEPSPGPSAPAPSPTPKSKPTPKPSPSPSPSPH